MELILPEGADEQKKSDFAYASDEKPSVENQTKVLSKKGASLSKAHLKELLKIFFSNVIPRYRKDKHVCPRCQDHRHVGLDKVKNVYPCVTCLNVYNVQKEWYEYAAQHEDLAYYAGKGREKGFIPEAD